MADVDVGRLVRDEGLNAVVGWALVAVMAATVVGSALTGEVLWAGFAAASLLVVVLPPIARRNPRAMLPWEILALAGLPILGRSVVPVPVGGQIATYLAVAALALVIAVELHLFTSVKMNATFAILFVVVATMAVAGLWALARWLSDLYLGSELLLVPDRDHEAIERALMIEFVVSTVVGLAAGVFFEFYVRRRAAVEARIAEVDPT